jgi:hypothetical protein
MRKANRKRLDALEQWVLALQLELSNLQRELIHTNEILLEHLRDSTAE